MQQAGEDAAQAERPRQTQRQAEREDIDAPEELYEVGTLAKIAQVVQAQDGTVRAIVQGQQRLRLVSFEDTDEFISARVEILEDAAKCELPVVEDEAADATEAEAAAAAGGWDAAWAAAGL